MKPLPTLLVLLALHSLAGQSVLQAQEIRLNQIGYYPEDSKIAMVPPDQTGTYALVDQKTGKEVFTGTLPDTAQTWRFAKEAAKVADFGSFAREGTYVLATAGARSPAFTIQKKAVYTPLLKAVLKGFYFWRASTEIPEKFGATGPGGTGPNYARNAGHPDDKVRIHASAATGERPAGTVIASPGGWYDAGDYNKYVVNAGVSVFFLAHALETCPGLLGSLSTEIPESGNGVPDILNELKWEYDWLLTMQDLDGGVYFKVTSKTFDAFEMPVLDRLPRFMVGKSTTSTLDFAAMAAMGYRIFKPFEAQFPGYADACLSAATRAWTWAKAHPAVEFRNPGDVHTGEYGDGNFKDEFFWAAAELLVSTGNPAWAAELNFNQDFTAPNWGNVCSNGLLSLALHKDRLPPGTDTQAITVRYRTLADRLRKDFDNSPWQVSMNAFNWGSNGEAASRGAVLMDAWFLLKDPACRRAGTESLHYLLGRNPTGYSFVTGFGTLSPLYIHDRRSGSDGIDAPIPGYLAGGPNGSANGDSGGGDYPSKAPAKRYLDVQDSYSTNEIAINWNAPLACLAAMVEQARLP